mmetsp:Transcript_23801/g.65801  ORF Transcript_23801/g.65801 Transcript_23801/m.65801 type:complete len:239 (+) Transcript_23801:190-906(+)
MSLTVSAQRKPARHERPTMSPPCSKASGNIVWAIMVSIAPAARPSTPETMNSVEGSSLEPGGKSKAPMDAPKAVRNVMVHHMRRMFLTWIPCAFMLPEELMLSGRLLRKTPITKGSAASADEECELPVAADLLIRMPMTSDSGIASIRMPSHTMIAAWALPPGLGCGLVSLLSASGLQAVSLVPLTLEEPLLGLRTVFSSARSSAISCSRSSRSWSVTRPGISSMTTVSLGRNCMRSW